MVFDVSTSIHGADAGEGKNDHPDHDLSLRRSYVAVRLCFDSVRRCPNSMRRCPALILDAAPAGVRGEVD